MQATAAKAATNISLICKVETFGERTDDVVEEKISFDAVKGYKTLKFVADGQRLQAEVISSLDTKKNLTVYGPNAFQPGNYTTVSCRTEGDISQPAN